LQLCGSLCAPPLLQEELDFFLMQKVECRSNNHREYQWQYSLGVQHELYRGVTANFYWHRMADYQQTLNINYAVPLSAWTTQTISNPLDGSPITVYNLSPNYTGLVPVLHSTNAPQSLRQSGYNGYEISGSARLPTSPRRVPVMTRPATKLQRGMRRQLSAASTASAGIAASR